MQKSRRKMEEDDIVCWKSRFYPGSRRKKIIIKKPLRFILIIKIHMLVVNLTEISMNSGKFARHAS